MLWLSEPKHNLGLLLWPGNMPHCSLVPSLPCFSACSGWAGGSAAMEPLLPMHAGRSGFHLSIAQQRQIRTKLGNGVAVHLVETFPYVIESLAPNKARQAGTCP